MLEVWGNTPKIGNSKNRNSVFFCQRHALLTSFDIFVVTYRVAKCIRIKRFWLHLPCCQPKPQFNLLLQLFLSSRCYLLNTSHLNLWLTFRNFAICVSQNASLLRFGNQFPAGCADPIIQRRRSCHDFGLFSFVAAKRTYQLRLLLWHTRINGHGVALMNTMAGWEQGEVLYGLVQCWIFARPLLRRPKRQKDIVATQTWLHFEFFFFFWRQKRF